MSNRKQFSSAWMTVASAPGTGNVTLGAAVRMRTSFGKQVFLTFVQAGFQNGDTFSYKISDKTVGWEEGEGTYNAGVVTRDTVFRNSLGTTAKLSFTADARIAPVLLSEDVAERLRSTDTFALTDTVALRDLLTRFAEEILSLDDFKLAVETTYDNAFVRARAYFEARQGGELRLPFGKVVQVTDEVNYRNLTKPIRITGRGQLNALVHGNFADAGKAIIDISFTHNDNRISGIGLNGFSICANGIIGDPIGIKAARSQEQDIRNVRVVGDGDTIMGATRKLFNSGIIWTQANNCEMAVCTIKAGYQPVGFDIGTTARFSGFNGDQTIAVNENVITDDMVGETILFSAGQTGDSIGLHWGVIQSLNGASPTNSFEIDNAPTADFSGAEASIGIVTGSIDIGTDAAVLNLDHPVAVEAMKGMMVCIPLAHIKTDSGNGKKGLLSTFIGDVRDASTVELTAEATASVSNVPIIFAPNVFVGTTADEDELLAGGGDTGRQTNDFVISDCQFESFQSVGLVCDRVFGMHIKTTKLEGEGFGGAQINKALRSAFCAILSEVKYLDITGCDFNYGWHPTRGPVWVMGSRGVVQFAKTQFYGGLKDQPLVYLDDEITDSFRLFTDPAFMSAGADKQSAGYIPVRIPASMPRAWEPSGPFVDRLGKYEIGGKRKHPGYLASKYYGGSIKPVAPSSAQATDTMYLHPIWLKDRARITALCIRPHSGIASTQALPGIYENWIDSALGTNRPGRLIAQAAAAIDTSGTSAGTNTDGALAAARWFEEGIHWLAVLISGAASLRAIDVDQNYWLVDLLGGNTIDQATALSSPVVGFSRARSFASGLDASLVGATLTAVTTDTCPHIFIKT